MIADFCDMCEKLKQSENTITTVSLNEIVNSLKSQITNVNDNMTKLNNEIINNFSIKLLELKKENIEDMKMLLTNNTTEKVGPLIQNYTSSLLDKTNILINDLFPKNQENLLKEMNYIMKDFHNSIADETKKLSSSSIDKNTIELFFLQFENKFSQSITQSQSVINNLFSSTETRIDNKITELKDISVKNINNDEILKDELSRILKKMENSSHKGKISENILSNILVPLFPNGEISSVGTQKETGDIILSRYGKPIILIENKNYNVNVPQDEVKKFIRDTEIQKCCGLFLSQNSGISHKNNFEISLNNGNVLIYLHNVNYDIEKIKIAIDVIDHFKQKMDEIVTEKEIDGDFIPKDILDEINREYRSFITNKISIIKNIKDNTEKTIKQLDALEFPEINKYLSSRYAFSSKTNNIVCPFCNKIWKNQSSLSAHLRNCKMKTDIIEQNEQNDSDNEINSFMSNEMNEFIHCDEQNNNNYSNQSKTDVFQCLLCNNFSVYSKKSLALHQRKCIKLHPNV
jgi:hypothetical protein